MAHIRPYNPADHDEVYDVCVRTANLGLDARGLYSDDALMPELFAGPYLEFEPELAFVVDTGEAGTRERVAGYIVATADTRAFVARYREEWMPGFAARYGQTAAAAATAGSGSEMSAEEVFVDLGLRPEHMLIRELDRYPAHLHIDLLPELQGQGFGRQLIRTLLAQLAARGVAGVHLGFDPGNVGAGAFYRRLGFVELDSSTPDAPLYGIATDTVL